MSWQTILNYVKAIEFTETTEVWTCYRRRTGESFRL